MAKCLICGKEAAGMFAVPLCQKHSQRFSAVNDGREVPFVFVRIIEPVAPFLTYLYDERRDIFVQFPKLKVGEKVLVPSHIADVLIKKRKAEVIR